MESMDLDWEERDESSQVAIEVANEVEHLESGFLDVEQNGVTYRIPVKVQQPPKGTNPQSDETLYVLLPNSLQSCETDQNPPSQDAGTGNPTADGSVPTKTKSAIAGKLHRDKVNREREERKERIKVLQDKLIQKKVQEGYMKGQLALLKTMMKKAL